MVDHVAYKFHMCIPCGKTFSLVPRSRLSVSIKVKYEGHIFQNLWLQGYLCFTNVSFSASK